MNRLWRIDSFDGAFVYGSTGRQKVSSLSPFLAHSLDHGFVMDTARMREEDIPLCRWLKFGLTKGITSPSRKVSIIGQPLALVSGFHGELMQGFAGVDPNPMCYAKDHKLGFDDFVRWVYFTNPHGKQDFIGVDFSIAERSTAGVADTMIRVKEVAFLCAEHGIPLNAELTLLNPRMCEPEFLTAWRRELGLITLQDWLESSDRHLGPGGGCCIRCGLLTRKPNHRFCRWCGNKHE